MKKKSLHDQLVDALLAKGEKILSDAKTLKYTIMTRTVKNDDTGAKYFFIGKNGAFRTGKNASSSYAFLPIIRDRLLARTTRQA